MVCEQNFSVPENENVPPLVVSVEMMPNVSPENDFQYFSYWSVAELKLIKFNHGKFECVRPDRPINN